MEVFHSGTTQLMVSGHEMTAGGDITKVMNGGYGCRLLPVAIYVCRMCNEIYQGH